MHFSHLHSSVLTTILFGFSALSSYLGGPLDSSWVIVFSCHHLEAFSMQKAVAMIGLTSFFSLSLREYFPCCLMFTALKTFVSFFFFSFLEERELCIGGKFGLLLLHLGWKKSLLYYFKSGKKRKKLVYSYFSIYL